MEGQIILMRDAQDYREGDGVAVSERDCGMAVDFLRETSSVEGGTLAAFPSGAPIIHSSLERARLAAERIGSAFEAPLFESERLRNISLSNNIHTYPVDFAGFLATELGLAGRQAWREAGSLLVVAHEPLVAAANGRHRAPHCYPFVFDNDQYRAMISLAIERRSLSVN